MKHTRRSVSRIVAAFALATLAACSDNVTGTDSDPAKLKTGSLLVTTSGLPNGIAANLKLDRASTSRPITAGSIQQAIEVGDYTLVAGSVVADGLTYDPQPVTQAVAISNNKQTSTSVTYTRRSGTISMTVTGLPNNANASVILTPPIGANVAVTGTTQIPGSVPGTWRMNASPVSTGGFTFTPSQNIQEGTLNPGGVLPFTVDYTISTGAIAVAITGLPVGSAGSVNITGPNGYARAVTATSTITDLVPGTYTVTSANVVVGGTTYRPATTSQQVVVGASTIAAPSNIAYSPMVSTLIIGVIDAPAGASNVVNVTGPGGFSRSVATTTTWTDVTPGTYTVNASPAVTALGTWTPSPASAQRTLTEASRDSVGVTYTLSTGSIAVAITGVSAGNVVVTGPGNFSRALSATQTILNLQPGTYTVTAVGVRENNVNYAPTAATQQVVVSPSLVAAPVTVAYQAQDLVGSVAITINGLPAGVNANVVLHGPTQNINKVTFNVTSSRVIDGLREGEYSITASNFTSGGVEYEASPLSQTVNVTSNTVAPAVVTYTSTAPGSDDLSIPLAYVMQSSQRPDGSVALVAGRDAMLRVFVVNNRANALTPKVRVRRYSGSTLVETTVIDAPEASARLATAEHILGSTWNLVIPASAVQPDMRLAVDVDPSGEVPESNETNNVWPSSGTQAINVVDVPDFNIMFVPVTVSGVTGNVNDSNKEQFLKQLRLLFPLRNVNSTVRAPFTSSAATLQANGNNWLTVLSEMQQLQAVEGPATTHFYGVVKVSYGSGVAGYGYVPGRAAMGWDHLPSGDGVAAHEWGHNFGRPHSPCGGAAAPDPLYPYGGGVTGMFGWNATTGALMPPTHTDIMGYCGSQWISDYTWTKVITYRQSSGMVTSAGVAGSVAAGGLLVSGTIANGRITLNPSYRVDAAPTPLPSSPTHRLEALGRRGQVLVDIPVMAQQVDHEGAGNRSFAVVVPWTAQLERSLASLRVRDVRSPLVATTVTSTTAAATVDDNLAPVLPDPDGTVERPRADRARIRFNAGQFRGAMVKDAATGKIIAFVRNSGDEIIARDGRAIDIVYSDGVRSVIRRNQR